MNDQPSATAEAAEAPEVAEAVPASTNGSSSQDTATYTATKQAANSSVGVGSGEGAGGKPGDAIVDDTPEREGGGVDNDNDMLGMGGDAAAAGVQQAAVADGGQYQHEVEGRRKRPPRVGSVKQGRKEKRKAEWKAKKARLKENKLYERKQREEAARKEGRELPAAGANYRHLPQEQWSVSQKINHAKRQEFEEKSTQGGYRVCIDMAFDDLMLEKAQASVGQQVMYAYSANRKAVQPCRVTLSGMGEVMRAQVGKLTGSETWLGVTTDARCYTEIFDKEELVYLTADSPDTITQLEKGKVYILGGLVDRNAHKGLCFKKATDQGIATAKLPLKRGDLNGAHTKVLATNHVFDILVQAMGAGGNLEKIEEKTLPPRKRAGWTGGDDRGPSSKSTGKRTDQQQTPEDEGEGNPDPSSVEKSDRRQATSEEVQGGAAAAVSSCGEDRAPSRDVTPTNAENIGQQKLSSEETDPERTNSDRDAEEERGPATGIKVQGVTLADGGAVGAASGTVVVKRAAVEEEGGDVSSSPGVEVDATSTCKRGRTETDSSRVA